MSKNGIERYSLSRNLRDRSAWATHLNDIRLLAMRNREPNYRYRLLADLKLLCLFHGHHILLADSDLNNNSVFQELFCENAHDLQAAFIHGNLKLAIRDTADNLEQVNDRQGPHRADPTMLARARPFTRLFDELHYQHSIWSVMWPLQDSASNFEARLDAIMADPVLLSVEQRQLLQRVSKDAKHGAESGALLFGRMYPILRDTLELELNDRVMMAVRAAHMLNTCMHLSLATSVADDDIDPEVSRFVLGLSPIGREIAVQETLLGLLPKRILTDTALNSIPFSRISEFQTDEAYFKALTNARRAYHRGVLSGEYETFLVALEDRMERIGKWCRVELYDWQKEFLQNRLKNHEERERRLSQVMYAIPVCLFASAAIVFGISISYLAPLRALGEGSKELGQRMMRKKAQPLRTLLASSNLAPTERLE